MKSTCIFGITAWLAASPCALGQSVIRTIVSGGPEGPAASANLNTPAAVACGPDGNVYVALREAHQVVRIDPAGMVWPFAGTGSVGSTANGVPAATARLWQPVALAVNASGEVYIADSTSHLVRRVARDGTIWTVAGNGRSDNTGDGGPATEAALKTPAALAFDINGNLLIADSGSHVVRMVTLDGRIVRIAGTGRSSSGGNDGPALEANLKSPAGVVADAGGNIYIADAGNNQIRIVTPDGTINRFAGADSSSSVGGGFGRGDPSLALNATLYAPTGMALDAAGSLYFIESGNLRVRRITADGRIANFAGTGTSGASGDGGLARWANLNLLGIALDNQGNLLIADGANHRVRIVSAATGVINTLAGNGLLSYNPRGLALNGNTLYFSDTGSHRVRKVDMNTGEITLVAGNGQAGFSGDGESAVSAALKSPRGLALDDFGNLYIADSGNHRIRRVDTSGNISTVAGDGTGAVTDDEGALATYATLYEPVDVALDAYGAIYIAERSGHRVRMVMVGGAVETVAGTGSGGSPSSESGQATAQRLYLPQALAVERSGSILVADTGNQRIRRIGTDGTITTVAGTGTAAYGGDGGRAVSAQLNYPSGVAVDEHGNIYIGDTSNHAVRGVDTGGGIATFAGKPSTAAGGFNGDGSPATEYLLSSPGIVIPAPDCSLILADTGNNRIRRLWPAVNYTITTDPPGLQLRVDGELLTTPVKVGWRPGTSHRIDTPEQQDGMPGTRYLGNGGQDVSVTCGPATQAVAVRLRTQYALAVGATPGGNVTPVDPWQDAASEVVLTATPDEGHVFAGWEGACTGTAPCRLTMDGPKTVTAHFAAIQN